MPWINAGGGIRSTARGFSILRNKESHSVHTDLQPLLEIQKLLRKEIEWRSKTCMHTWVFLASATGLIFREVTTWWPSNINSSSDDFSFLKIQTALAFISLLWVVGLWYIIEKRTWITNIGHYIKQCIEPKLYAERHRVMGWEQFGNVIRKRLSFGKATYILIVEVIAGIIIIGVSLYFSCILDNFYSVSHCFYIWPLLHLFFIPLIIFRLGVKYWQKEELKTIINCNPHIEETGEKKRPLLLLLLLLLSLLLLFLLLLYTGFCGYLIFVCINR